MSKYLSKSIFEETWQFVAMILSHWQDDIEQCLKVSMLQRLPWSLNQNVLKQSTALFDIAWPGRGRGEDKKRKEKKHNDELGNVNVVTAIKIPVGGRFEWIEAQP